MYPPARISVGEPVCGFYLVPGGSGTQTAFATGVPMRRRRVLQQKLILSSDCVRGGVLETYQGEKTNFLASWHSRSTGDGWGESRPVSKCVSIK